MYDIRADSVEIRGCAGQDKYYLQEDINKIKEQIEDMYADQLRGLDNYVIEAWPGIPHTEILKLARKEDVDLIVMGSHTREENRIERIKRL